MFLVKMVNRHTDETIQEQIFGTKKEALDFANRTKNKRMGFIITDLVTDIVEEFEV